MTPIELQTWLNAHGATLVVDGEPGKLTREAILKVFTNSCAPAITDAELDMIARRLGCSLQQLKAVSKVESGGKAFDDSGRPKILFERHYFHRLTRGAFSPAEFSLAKGGGYNVPSWGKLVSAACRDADAAFSSCSWGKFQVMGAHWHLLNYPSPIEMAYSTVTSEAAHYEMLARFVEANDLKGKLKAISSDPDSCRPFAKAYNGSSYEDFDYHNKIAEAMN